MAAESVGFLSETPMAIKRTPNAQLCKPEVCERNWDVPLNQNADFLDGVAAIAHLLVTAAEIPSSSLRVRVTPGSFIRQDGTVVEYAGTNAFDVPGSANVALWLSDSGTLSTSADFPSTPHVRLAKVTTGPTSVTRVSDERIPLRVCGSLTANLDQSVDSTMLQSESVVGWGRRSFETVCQTTDVGSCRFAAVEALGVPSERPGRGDHDEGTSNEQKSQTDYWLTTIIAKVNELVEAVNQLGRSSR